MLIFMMSLAGIPPFAGFAGKFVLFSSALADSLQNGMSGLAWLVGLAVVMSAISLYYYLSVLKQAFVHGGEHEGGEPLTMSLSHTLAVVLPAIAIVVLGIFPALLLDPIKAAVLAALGLG